MASLLDMPLRETDLLPIPRQQQYDQYLLNPATDAPIASTGLLAGEATAGPAFMRGRIKGLLGDNPFSRGINTLSELLGIDFAHDVVQRDIGGMGTTPLERSLAAAMVLPIPMPGKGKVASKIARAAADRAAARDAVQVLTPPVHGPPPTPEMVGKTLRQQQAAELSGRELEKLALASQASPEFKQASQWMMPGELRTVLNNPRGVEQVSRLMEVLPTAKNVAATATLGMPKQGWYNASSRALFDVFGADAPRFTQLLAATSPQTSVEMNLLNSLNIWKNWTAAGRPTDPKAIKAIMGASVAGDKGTKSVLDAWFNNTVRALAAPDPSKVVLSGPKVDSFYRNLMGDVMRVTNDAHMANFSRISQDLLRVSPSEQQLLAGNPGLSPAYAALSSRVREGGSMADMLPAEAQETVWSVAQQLVEMQKRTGLPAREIIERGMLTPDVIRSAPDFSTLLNVGPYRDVLEGAGYSGALEGLRPHIWPTVTPGLSFAQQNEILRVARRLEGLAALRSREKAARAPGIAPSRAPVYATAEGIPGADIGHLPGLLTAPYGQRKNLTSRISSSLLNPENQDIIHRGVGLNAIRTRPMQGAFRASPAHPIEYQPGFAAGVDVPIAGGKTPRMRAADEQRMHTAATLRGAMTAQHGSPYSGMVPHKQGADLFVPHKGKLKQDEIKAFVNRYGLEDVAVADVGEGVNILNWTGTPYTPAQQVEIHGLLGAPAKKQAATAKNIADPNMSYVDLQSEWLRPPGSGAVTQRVMDALGKLSAKDLKRLDSKDLHRAAGDLHKIYSGQAKKGEPVRADLMNMLAIVRDSGLAGLRAALGKKEFLPALAAIGLAPTVYQMSRQEAGT